MSNLEYIDHAFEAQHAQITLHRVADKKVCAFSCTMIESWSGEATINIGYGTQLKVSVDLDKDRFGGDFLIGRPHAQIYVQVLKGQRTLMSLRDSGTLTDAGQLSFSIPQMENPDLLNFVQKSGMTLANFFDDKDAARADKFYREVGDGHGVVDDLSFSCSATLPSAVMTRNHSSVH